MKCETHCKSATSQEVVEPTIHVNPPRDRSLKRKTPDDASESALQLQPPPNRVSVIVPRPCSCFWPCQIVMPPPPPSPTQSFDILNNSDLAFTSTSSSLGPPPLILSASLSSSSSFISQLSASLEIMILHLQLDAANSTLCHEHERSQQERNRFQEECQVMEEAFAKERAAYLEFIKSLESCH